jgi:hypothetical protein
VLVQDDTLSWPEVAARLAAARNYWLCTTTPSGAPHAAPVYAISPQSAMMWLLANYEASPRRWTS